MSGLVQRAKELAHRAHAGQVDKAGRPYIEHVARVAAAASDDPEAEVVAWLHDVYEDCEWFRGGLTQFGPVILGRVLRLSRHKGEPEKTYYGLIRDDAISLRVKLADIADNSDEARLALLDPKTADRLRRKYKRALEMLGVPDAD